MEDSKRHPHMVARGTYLDVDGTAQPGPAPRFSRTKPAPPTPPQEADPAQAADILAEWRVSDEVAALRASGLSIRCGNRATVGRHLSSPAP